MSDGKHTDKRKWDTTRENVPFVPSVPGPLAREEFRPHTGNTGNTGNTPQNTGHNKPPSREQSGNNREPTKPTPQPVTVSGVPLDVHLASTVDPVQAVDVLPGETAVPVDVRQLLAELELLSHGVTARIDPTPAGQGAGGRMVPPGDAYPPHVEWRARYLGCRSDRARDVVVAAMREQLRLWRCGPDRSAIRVETAEQLAARIVADGVGLTVGEASVRFRCTVTMVRRARRAAGRDVDVGDPLPDAVPLPDRGEVLRLRAGGLSVRAISMRTGVPRSTVHEWITGTGRRAA